MSGKIVHFIVIDFIITLAFATFTFKWTICKIVVLKLANKDLEQQLISFCKQMTWNDKFQTLRRKYGQEWPCPIWIQTDNHFFLRDYPLSI